MFSSSDLKRSKGVTGAKVNFTEDMAYNSKKQLFLSNKSNKQNFVNLLGINLQASGCTVIHAEVNADRLLLKLQWSHRLTTPRLL